MMAMIMHTPLDGAGSFSDLSFGFHVSNVPVKPLVPKPSEWMNETERMNDHKSTPN